MKKKENKQKRIEGHRPGKHIVVSPNIWVVISVYAASEHMCIRDAADKFIREGIIRELHRFSPRIEKGAPPVRSQPITQ